MKDTWKYEFRPVILERGEDYWMSGNVEEVTKTSDGWHAVVNGSHEYDVDIEMDGDEVADMSCTCPYADDHNCKHMAAVLFAIDNGEFETADEAVGFRDEANDILEELDAEKLREELKEIMEEEPKYRKRITARHRRRKADTRDISSCISDLDHLAYKYGDRHGYIDWKSGFGYVNAFLGCLSDCVDPMIRRREIMPAFEVLKGAFHIVNTVEMDGSNGEHGDIAGTIEDYWNTLIKTADPDEKDTMYKWFVSMEDKAHHLICADTVSNILDHSFEEERYVLPRLEKIRSFLSGTKDEWNMRVNLLRYRDYLNLMKMDLSEYTEWLKSHRQFQTVRDLLYREAEAAGDYETMTGLVLESISYCDAPWKKKDYVYKLVQIYRMCGERAKEKQTLKDLLFIYGSQNMDRIHEFRDLCGSEEWEKLREAYLSLNPAMKAAVYADEKKYDRLMEAIRDSDLQTYDRYYDELSGLYPEEYITIYSGHLQKIEHRHGGAVLYREMDSYLRKIAEIKGGKEIVLEFLEVWERMFPNRKAMKIMMDEIRLDLHPL